MKTFFRFMVIGLGLVLLNPHQSFSADLSSESIDARKGVFRLLSADVNEPSEYSFRATIQYFSDTNLWEDERDGEGLKSTLAFGYAFTPNIYAAFEGGFETVSRESGNVEQNFTLIRYASSITGSFDAGRRWGMKDNRLLLAGSLWLDFSKVSRFFKGLNVHPQFILTSDWSDLKPVPLRYHFNLGFKPASDSRFFNSTDTVTDLERTATRSLDHYAITAATGVEFPTEYVRPSLEAHMDYVPENGFSESPKWVTLGLKSKPFPQKNIELLAAVDVGLSSYTRSTNAIGQTVIRPDTYATPFWNVLIGFGLTQFGKLPNEVGIDKNELSRQQRSIREQRNTLKELRAHLRYNTVNGKVVDAKTGQPIAGVNISFPENPEIPEFETNRQGEFTRYFAKLDGYRMQFTKEGYAPSSKFLVLKPGEGVQVGIEMEEAGESTYGDFVISVTDEAGRPIQAAVGLMNVKSKEITRARTDTQGKLNLKIPDGEYRVEVRASGYSPAKDSIELGSGKAVLRTYSLIPVE